MLEPNPKINFGWRQHSLLVNLSRPYDMRNQPIPKKPKKGGDTMPARSAARPAKGGNMKVEWQGKGYVYGAHRLGCGWVREGVDAASPGTAPGAHQHKSPHPSRSPHCLHHMCTLTSSTVHTDLLHIVESTMHNSPPWYPGAATRLTRQGLTRARRKPPGQTLWWDRPKYKPSFGLPRTIVIIFTGDFVIKGFPSMLLNFCKLFPIKAPSFKTFPISLHLC